MGIDKGKREEEEASMCILGWGIIKGVEMYESKILSGNCKIEIELGIFCFYFNNGHFDYLSVFSGKL